MYSVSTNSARDKTLPGDGPVADYLMSEQSARGNSPARSVHSYFCEPREETDVLYNRHHERIARLLYGAVVLPFCRFAELSYHLNQKSLAMD